MSSKSRFNNGDRGRLTRDYSNHCKWTHFVVADPTKKGKYHKIKVQIGAQNLALPIDCAEKLLYSAGSTVMICRTGYGWPIYSNLTVVDDTFESDKTIKVTDRVAVKEVPISIIR